MRSLALLLATLQFLSIFVAAHPFIIVNPKITPVQEHVPQRTHHYERRQDFLSELQSAANSILGVGGETTLVKATTRAAVTLPPPAVASATQSSQAAESTPIEEDDDDDNEGDGENDDEGDGEDNNEDDNENDNENDGSTTSAAESSTTDPETAAATTQSSTTSTAASSAQLTSAPPVPPPTLGSAQTTAATTTTATPSAATTNNSATASSMPPAGIAIAIIMSLLIISLTAWLIFKYHPKTRAWWTARKQAQFHQRSYRDALDGPDALSPNLRQRALSSNASASKRQTLKSFFVPATAKLGHGKEIKRKPVNWGIETSKADSDSDSEKISMTATAAPMGQIERYLMLPAAAPVSAPATQPVSPVSLRAKESLEQLPPISPMNSVSVNVREPPPISISISSAMVMQDKDKDLRALPPVPVPSLPPLIHAKRGSDGVFRLA